MDTKGHVSSDRCSSCCCCCFERQSTRYAWTNTTHLMLHVSSSSESGSEPGWGAASWCSCCCSPGPITSPGMLLSSHAMHGAHASSADGWSCSGRGTTNSAAEQIRCCQCFAPHPPPAPRLLRRCGHPDNPRLHKKGCAHGPAQPWWPGTETAEPRMCVLMAGPRGPLRCRAALQDEQTMIKA